MDKPLASHSLLNLIFVPTTRDCTCLIQGAVHNLLELLPAFEHLSTAFFVGLSCHSLGFRSLMPNPFVSPLLASLLSLFPNTGNQELCLGSLSTDSSYVATFHGFVFVHCLQTASPKDGCTCRVGQDFDPWQQIQGTIQMFLNRTNVNSSCISPPGFLYACIHQPPNTHTYIYFFNTYLSISE